MTTSELPTDPTAPDGPRDDRHDATEHFAPRLVAIGLVAVAAAALAARFFQPSAIWGTEAIDVALGRLPFDHLLDALRHAGGPPLWIVILHGWSRIVGTGDAAVRALPALLSIATVPVFALLGRRLAGRRGAADFAFVAAVSPCLLRYGSDAGPGSLVILLSSIGGLCIVASLDEAAPLRLAAVAASSAALVWTAYWSIAVVGAAVVTLLVLRRHREGAARRTATATAVAVTAGMATLLFWAPILWFQLSKAGTPWGDRVRPATIVTTTVMELNGGPSLMLLVTIPLVVVGIFGCRQRGTVVRLDLRGRTDAAGATAVLGIGLVLAAAITLAAGVTFVAADAPTFLIAYLTLVALGLCRLDGTTRSVVLSATAVIASFVLVTTFNDERTQVRPAIAAIEAASAGPSVIVACPDQVGPSLYRAARRGMQVVRFPDLGAADTVDWVGYDTRLNGTDPAKVAAEARALAAGRPVFVVIGRGYRGGGGCNGLVAALGARSGARVVMEADVDEYRESMRVYAFGPT